MIIGTMNTADRSISHIDAALRRRFHFFPLFRTKNPSKDCWSGISRKDHPRKQLEWVAKIVGEVNKKLDDRHGSIGHSYFMPDNPDDLNERWVERVWKYSIMPLIEDRFIDQPDRVKELEFERLRGGLREERAREAV